eukprot:6656800-Pyramimonas_sp.AAC.2
MASWDVERIRLREEPASKLGGGLTLLEGLGFSGVLGGSRGGSPGRRNFWFFHSNSYASSLESTKFLICMNCGKSEHDASKTGGIGGRC